MSKNYYENANLVNYIKSNIDAYSKVDPIYKPLLTDIMLRRISEFGFGKNEIFEDITALINNLNEIRIEDFSKRKGFESAGGIYFPNEKAIALSKDYLNAAIETGDYTIIHEILTHEVFHALSRTPEGFDKLSKLNRFTGKPNTALLECIIEKAADRCTFSRESDLQGNIPMFHKNKFGYTSITFAVDAIAAAYGVSERALLHNAIRGHDRMVEFLSAAGSCQEEETNTFLDKVDINLARLYNLDYSFENNKDLTKEEKIRTITNSISCIYLACENNILNNTGIKAMNLNPTLLLEEFANTMLLSHLRLTKIITSTCKNFSSRYEPKDIDGIQMINTVLSRNEGNCNEISNRFNQMQGVVTAMQKDPTNKDLRTLFNWAAYGNLNNYNSDKLIELGIDIKNHSFVVNEDVMRSFLHNDYEIVSWDNSIIQTWFAQIYKEVGKTEEKGFFDKVKGLFSRNKPLALGTHEDNIESENEIIDLPVSENLYKLTPEELKKFNEGVSEVIANQRKKDVQEVDEESKSNDSTSLDDWTN